MTKKPVEMTKEISTIKREIAPIVEVALNLKIDSPAQMKIATETLSRLNVINDKIKEEKEKVTVPLNEALKAERGRWKPIESMYEEGIDSLRAKMGDYQTEMTRKEEAEKAKIANRVGEGKGKFKLETAIEKISEVEAPDAKIATDSGMVKFRKVQELRITDYAKIPRRFLVVDEKAVLEALKAGIVVPGAEIEERQVPVNFR